MAQTYTYSKCNQVYYHVGNFVGTQDPRYVRAPFDLITINGAPYLQPVPCMFSSQAIAQTASADSEQARLARQSAGMYLDIAPVIVAEHEMGTIADSHNWRCVHKFGWV